MQTADYVVLAAYFVVMAAVGLICMWKVRRQEDYFLGGRSFGKLLQTFAAFGAGTGANDPIQVGRTVWTSGLSGIWSVLMWLFVTPFYWIFGVWYRRMRHLTLGDWFVERYESKGLGAAYTVFGIAFYMMYLSTMFSAISKVAAPLIGFDAVNVPGFSQPVGLEYVLVPLIAVVVILYGVLGGLRAAYWTDLIQGTCIIFLSVILVPYGLSALVEKYGDEHGLSADATAMDGFRVMHERVAGDYFNIFGGPSAGEFPWHFIISLTLLGLIGIVVQPHFIATGGGSAKTETAARLGLVTGNFLKRLCTVGWALTALIALALMADDPRVAADPDSVWGVASQTILGPLGLGLVGLMLACLLAALMSSADCYMLVTSALVVRNIYAAYVRRDAEERTYILAGRVTSVIVIVGAAVVSLYFMDVFGQFVLALEVLTVFAAPFWVGMFWRRATRLAACWTVVISALIFFVIPIFAPVLYGDLRTLPSFAVTNDMVQKTTARQATPADKAQRDAALSIWQRANDRLQAAWEEYQQNAPAVGADGEPSIPSAARLIAADEALAAVIAAKQSLEALGPRPEPVEVGQSFSHTITTGGKAIFWTDGVAPVEEVQLDEVSRREEGDSVIVTRRHTAPMQGRGRFNLDFLLYQWFGMDLRLRTDAELETLRMPPKLITPFLLMIVLSLVTPRNRKEALDRYYVKMKTPVEPDPIEDVRVLELAYQQPQKYDHKKLFPTSNWEFIKPSVTDVAGFIGSFFICFLIIGLIVWLAGIGQ